MLGTFDLRLFGRFVISGGTPEELLWDLFDQSVFGSSTLTSVGGAKVAIPNRDGAHLDGDDRRALRRTPEWARVHSDYFGDIIADGNLIRPIALPPAVFFELHCARLVGLVANTTYSSYRSMGYRSLMMLKHGVGTPAYDEAIRHEPDQGYPFVDYAPANVINYFLLKGILTLQDHADGQPFGILSPEEVARCIRLEDEAVQQEKDELHRVALASAKKPRTKRTSHKA